MLSRENMQKFRDNWVSDVLLVVNLGCEMVYVLHHSMEQQQYPKERANEALNAIAAQLLQNEFVQNKNFHSSELMPIDRVRRMLQTCVHHSGLLVSRKSMDKLWDMMTMVYKWQLFLARRTFNVVSILFQHLEMVHRIVGGTICDDFFHYFARNNRDYYNPRAQKPIHGQHVERLRCFYARIPLLIKMRVQTPDGRNFVYNGYVGNVCYMPGDDVYAKVLKTPPNMSILTPSGSSANQVAKLPDMIHIFLADTEVVKIFTDNFKGSNALRKPLHTCLPAPSTYGGPGDSEQSCDENECFAQNLAACIADENCILSGSTDASRKSFKVVDCFEHNLETFSAQLDVSVPEPGTPVSPDASEKSFEAVDYFEENLQTCITDLEELDVSVPEPSTSASTSASDTSFEVVDSAQLEELYMSVSESSTYGSPSASVKSFEIVDNS